MAEPDLRILVAPESFDAGAEIGRLLATAGDQAGGLASFLGVVRGGEVRALDLEHYPGMTERCLAEIAGEACDRFRLVACTVIHRVGRLVPGDPIVLVLAAAAHRQPALEATAFLIDWLKTRAPFWKREHLQGGATRWVEVREADDEAAAAWEK